MTNPERDTKSSSMERKVYFPIRLKIMVSLLCAVTLVVCLITFTMANFFHDDKQAYMKDWVSIAALSTAEECRSLLVGYARRLELVSLIMLDEEARLGDKQGLLENVFDSFPQLVEVVIHRDGEDPRSAADQQVLEAAGLSEADTQLFRDEHPLPLERILAGEVL